MGSALLYLSQNKKQKGVTTVGKIKIIEVIVRENDYDFFMNRKRSTVAIKWQKGKKQYGEYIVFLKPELTVAEVVETVNELLEKVTGKKTKISTTKRERERKQQ